MSQLPNSTKEALREIKAALKTRIASGVSGGSITWERVRYADNLDQWTALAAVEVAPNEKRLRVIFIYLADILSERAEARQTKVKATYAVEVIEQFHDGTDESNSTISFEDTIGEIVELFMPDETLGFTDAASQAVYNSPVRGEGQSTEGGRPQYVDGVLSHRKLLFVDIDFRVCKGSG